MKTLNDMGMARASHIETGFGGWRDAALPIQTYEEWRAARRAASQERSEGSSETGKA